MLYDDMKISSWRKVYAQSIVESKLKKKSRELKRSRLDKKS